MALVISIPVGAVQDAFDSYKEATDKLNELRDLIRRREEVLDKIDELEDAESQNETEDVVMRASFTSLTRKMINWENFEYTNIPDIADSFWMPEAF